MEYAKFLFPYNSCNDLLKLKISLCNGNYVASHLNIETVLLFVLKNLINNRKEIVFC